MATRSVLPFVVETGQAGSDSTSYCTVDFADIFLDRVPDAYKAVWLAADVFLKEQALVWATSLLDSYIYFPQYNQPYRSIRLTRNQALHFPRAGLSDYDGWVIDERSVPVFMQQATAMLAFELCKSDRVVEPTRGLISASVGPLSVHFDSNYSHTSRVIPRSVLAIVSPFGGRLRGAPGLKSVPLFRA